MSDDQPQVESAIIWFEGYGPDSEFYGPAILAGGFDLFDHASRERRAWPASVEVVLSGREPLDERTNRFGRRVGIDVHRRCFVVEIGSGGSRSEYALINIDAASAVLALGRQAIGEG